ncbi:UDP-Glycosyltransferase/glycogen phosphorylase [Lojkania enalia]|uniref:UDP-Glycosyltransferase/glycogen phosphorylase n=1 Tax=Lojkania enalia TaxID=147567 RepID=A0A9P4K1X3_9PLEO|nr:UDP-Glycosyltransferase/glycogen phosphorylase [Didymosphaeria enalia]
MSLSNIHIVVSVAFQDAGDTTRAIAMAVALRDQCPPNINLKIDFLSCGSRFEYQITNAGFPIVPARPRVKGISVAHDLGWDFPEFFGSEEIAKSFIEGQLAALRELKPDVVFHGMWAPASLAARILGIRTINFLPVPLHPGAFSHGLIRDLPDMMPLFTRLPRPIRQRLAWFASGAMIRAPIFRQHRLGAAAAACGWPIKGPISLFDMNMADLNIVNDHPVFHADYLDRIPKNIVLTGPLYATSDAKLDPEIVAHMERPGPSILVTMGSSGTQDFLFEAIKALISSPSDDWNAVVLASPSVCAIEDARRVANNDPRLLVTDKFIPALQATQLADAALIHGGQGTVQTAVAAGTPVVGVALQIEQQTNLDNVMNAGAGIRVQRQHWNAESIRQALRTVLDDGRYAERAKGLADTLNDMDGAKVSAEHMWRFILNEECGEKKLQIVRATSIANPVNCCCSGCWRGRQEAEGCQRLVEVDAHRFFTGKRTIAVGSENVTGAFRATLDYALLCVYILQMRGVWAVAGWPDDSIERENKRDVEVLCAVNWVAYQLLVQTSSLDVVLLCAPLAVRSYDNLAKARGNSFAGRP